MTVKEPVASSLGSLTVQLSEEHQRRGAGPLLRTVAGKGDPQPVSMDAFPGLGCSYFYNIRRRACETHQRKFSSEERTS